MHDHLHVNIANTVSLKYDMLKYEQVGRILL